MPHTKGDAVLRTPGQSWQLPPLARPRTQIRLIHFRPGSDDDEISADIEMFDLDTAPEFKAISYTWGKDPPQHIVKIHDVPVFVRPNCQYALWQARQHFPESRVWLDAICIDQNDLGEKSIQVAIMVDIYAQAANVLACIGTADESSDGVRDALIDPDSVVQDLPTVWADKVDMELWDPPQDEATTLKLLKKFREFCDRPYFSRLWVIQELFAGKDHVIILCGANQLCWHDILDLNRRLNKCSAIWSTMRSYGGENKMKLNRLDSLLSRDQRSYLPLQDLLYLVREFHCDDARDRVFGTFRLIDWTRLGKSPPVPNYEISPLQLASYLMSLIEYQNVHFARDIVHFARDIVSLLDLADEHHALKDRLPALGCDTMLNVVPAYSPKRMFSTCMHGAHLIQRDHEGRLYVALERKFNPDARSLPVSERFRLPPDSSKDLCSFLRERGLVPIFTDNDVSVLACPRVQPGDIILHDYPSDLVLRAQDDGLRFTIIGPALLVNRFNSRQSDDAVGTCICWDQVSSEDYEHRFVHLALEMSDKEAIAAEVSRSAFLQGKVDRWTYLKRRSLGTMMRGAVLTDVIMDNLDDDQEIGPTKAMCTKHQASEDHRLAGHALWYNVLMDGGDCVYVDK